MMVLRRSRLVRRLVAVGGVLVLATSGCSFQGLNSLALPGAVGRSSGDATYRVQVANVGTLESNSPVMMDDVVIGSVGPITVENWHAVVEVAVKRDVVVPANTVATVGQTSLLGSMHVALGPPLGQQPSGRLAPGNTIPLSQSQVYPSTEQTLSSLSALVNGGGLGEIGEIVHNFNLALSGRETKVRDLLTRLDRFIGVFDKQRADVIASLEAMNRLAGTLADQRDVLTTTLRDLPPALDVLIEQRPRFTAALDRLRTFSDVATTLVNDSQADLVRNLTNLGPTIKALADVGPEIDTVLAYATVMPFGQNVIDRGLRGDYINLFANFDLTVNRFKRDFFLGTRWGNPDLPLIPAPGDPGYNFYYNNIDPLRAPIAPPPVPLPPDMPTAPSPEDSSEVQAGPAPQDPPTTEPASGSQPQMQTGNP
jgi:phospholipid/cholesterol/gamma-HCH transport system substrate-binding protein